MRLPSRRSLGLLIPPFLLGLWAWWQSQSPSPTNVKLFEGEVLALYVSPDGWVRAIGKESETSYSQKWESPKLFKPLPSQSWFDTRPPRSTLTLKDIGLEQTTKRTANFAQFRNDGHLLVVGESDSNGQNPLRFYDTLQASPLQFRGVATAQQGGSSEISPDFKWISLVGSDPYDYGNNWILRPIKAPEGTTESPLKEQAQSSAFSDDGRSVFVALTNGTVQQWSVYPLHELHSWGQPTPSPEDRYRENSIVPSPDGSLCLWQHDSSFEMLNCTTGQTIPLRDSWNAAKWTPDGKHFVLFGSQGTTIFDARDGSFVRYLRVGGNVTASAFSPDSRYLFVGNSEGNVTRWDLN